MGGLTFLRKINEAIDRRYLRKVGATPIPGSGQQLLLFCYHPYHARKELRLSETVIIRPGDTVSELHFSNTRIVEIGAQAGDRPLECRIIDILKEEFSILAEACRNGTVPPEVKAFYGVNVMPAGAKRLGFTLVPLPRGFNRWWLGLWESLLRLVYYSYQTKKKASLKRTMNDPYEIWISRDELIRRYARV